MSEDQAAVDAAKAAAAAEAAAEEAMRRAAELRKAAEEAAATAAADDAPATPPTAGTPTESDSVPPATAPAGELSELAQKVRDGYTFEGTALVLGALVENGEPVPQAQVTIPFGMLNRHGLVAGATGTGKTKTLQALAEQIAAGGVPVFAADIKGDLSGIASPGEANEKLTARCKGIGQDWTSQAAPAEYFTLGGMGTGVPIRASITSFGPTLLSKVLGLNETQESSLSLVFHYAKNANLPLVTLDDLRAVLTYLASKEGKAELTDLGGLSAATVGVILRELIAFADAGADVFFGEPEIDVNDFIRTTSDGKGIVSLLEVPGVQDKPELFSTFLMYLLQRLFQVLPEVGDADKPKLVFFFDEAHLLFNNASKDFLASVTQTVRLIRSKGVGIFFVTQTPKDVPDDVLAQLGSRIQHQLRVHTPDDAKALKATVSTYPTSGYDLGQVLTELGIGEAIVTVMNEKGAPTPVAWTRMRAPQSLMAPTPAAQLQATVASSPLMSHYGTAAATDTGAAAVLGKKKAETDAAAAADARTEELHKEAKAAQKSAPKKSSSRRMSPVEKMLNQAARTATSTATREIFRSLFGRK